MVCPKIAIRCWLSALIGMSILFSSLLMPQSASFEGDNYLEASVHSDLGSIDSNVSGVAFSNETNSSAILESHHSELIEETEEKFFDSIALPVSSYISAWSTRSKSQARFASSNSIRSALSLPLRC